MSCSHTKDRFPLPFRLTTILRPVVPASLYGCMLSMHFSRKGVRPFFIYEFRETPWRDAPYARRIGIEILGGVGPPDTLHRPFANGDGGGLVEGGGGCCGWRGARKR